MRVLVTGGTGYVGSFVLEALLMQRVSDDVWYTYHSRDALSALASNSSVHAVRVDLTDAQQTREMVESLRPEVIVHLAAHTNTKTAEEDPDRCMLANEGGTRNLVQCLDSHTKFILFSTDWVYRGEATREEPYAETDATEPENVYGRSKVAAERVVLEAAAERGFPYVILRSALIFGPPAVYSGQTSFFEWFNVALANGKTVQLFTDEIRSPVYVRDIAGIVVTLLRDDAHWNQVYNMGGRDLISRFEFGRRLALSRGYNLDLLLPSKASDVFKDGSRPSKLGMSIDKLLTFYPALRTVDEALADMDAK